MHVEHDVYRTRLLQLKGKRTVTVREVPLSSASLNKGGSSVFEYLASASLVSYKTLIVSDVFLLDAGLKLFIFDGESSNKYERAKAIEVYRKAILCCDRV